MIISINISNLVVEFNDTADAIKVKLNEQAQNDLINLAKAKALRHLDELSELSKMFNYL